MGNNVLFTMFSFFICVVACFGRSDDESALLAFKSKITYDPYNILAKNWSRGTPFCNWIGITCSRRHGRVTSLNLTSMDLQGSIANEIGNLSALRYMYLDSNSFTGNIPNGIGKLSSLRTLDLHSNGLTGSIPNEVGNLLAVRHLDFQYNILTGRIPNEVGNLSAIQYLNFRFNILTGGLPNEIGNLTKLQTLNLEGNGLTGTIPYSIGSLSNLGILNIGNNSFHGHIPRDLGQLSSLTVLGLYYNELNGEIPESIYNLSKLRFFELANNRISGNLPSSMGNVLPDLELVPLHNNQFSGEIPISISNLSQLQILNLNTNLFTGRVPTNLGTLQKLEILDIDDNHLTNDPSMFELDFLISLRNCSKLKTIRIGKNSFDGRLPKSLALGGNLSQSLETLEASSCGIKGIIPNEIANLSNLIWLEIGGNDLEGEIPGALSRLSKLQKLILNSSKLKGSIPVTLCDLGRLYELNLANNQLSEQLPRCLGNISSLQRIYLGHNELTSVELSALWRNKNLQIVDLSSNNFNGSLGSEIGSVQGMQVLNLSGNQFSGDIPITIGRLEHLEKLIFSSNNLHGYIPESFSELVALQYLDLSQNTLSGAIPKSLEKLPNLVYFNVSFNRLSGEIPNEGLFKNLTADSFIGNKELCGASRFKVMQCKARSSSKTRAWKYILPSIAFIICLAIIVVWLMRHRNRNTTLTSQSSSLVTVKRISYYDILKSTSNFDDKNLIGRGSIGTVYKGTFSNGMIAAIKVFNLDLESANHSFDTECNILCNIRHRNLVKVISSCSNLDLKALVLDYMSKGNFSSWLYSSNYCLNMDQRLEIMIDLASAMEYLHHGHPFPVVHCDLKPSNILLDEDMVAHVADFGISKPLTQDQIILHTKTLGTIGYMAPEYGSTGMISTMADVYSYGILLMETFTKKKPTDDMFAGELNLRRWLLELYPDAIVQVMDVDLVDGVEENIKAKESCFRSIMGLALECTADLPEERLSMENVLIRLKKIKMEFLSNVTEEE